MQKKILGQIIVETIYIEHKFLSTEEIWDLLFIHPSGIC